MQRRQPPPRGRVRSSAPPSDPGVLCGASRRLPQGSMTHDALLGEMRYPVRLGEAVHRFRSRRGCQRLRTARLWGLSRRQRISSRRARGEVEAYGSAHEESRNSCIANGTRGAIGACMREDRDHGCDRARRAQRAQASPRSSNATKGPPSVTPGSATETSGKIGGMREAIPRGRSTS